MRALAAVQVAVGERGLGSRAGRGPGRSVRPPLTVDTVQQSGPTSCYTRLAG